jgi:hypothetical protein
MVDLWEMMMSYSKPPMDLTGQTFGSLTVLGKAKGRYKWECRCMCGNIVVALGGSIIRINNDRCQCYRRKRPNQVNVTHHDKIMDIDSDAAH